MPDAFFASDKARKRKRSTPGPNTPGPSSKKVKRKGSKPNGSVSTTKKRIPQPQADDTSESSDGGGIDDLDLRQSDHEETSGDEDADETPAEKRLRLAQMYLDGLKKDLG